MKPLGSHEFPTIFLFPRIYSFTAECCVDMTLKLVFSSGALRWKPYAKEGTGFWIPVELPHRHQEVLVKDLAWWLAHSSTMNNNDYDDEKGDVDVHGRDNFDDDHDPFINNGHKEFRVFITCGCENKAAGLTTESNLDYTESSSLLGTEKLMSRCLSKLLRSLIIVFKAQTQRSGRQRKDLGAGKKDRKEQRNQLDQNYQEFMFGGNLNE